MTARDEGSAPEQLASTAVWTVAELSNEIHRRLGSLGRVAVEGEVIELKRAGSGHVYFKLKDLDAVLSCAIWRSRVAGAMRFDLKDGMRVIAHGSLDVYRPRGTYSLIVDRLEARGAGDLMARFEEAKRQLRERGWFDRARPLPAWPRVVGLVTSRDGAALQDFLRTRSARWPLYPVRLVHTPVQGPGAATEIADAVGRLAASGVDLIVLARGGGSLEDLWAFNEMPVAEAIWESPVPVVSGVGHETDFSLADFVADLRAHTPTDAAQRVIPDRAALIASLERQAAYLASAVDRQLERRRERLDGLARMRPLRSAAWILGDRQSDLAELGTRLRRRALEGLTRREEGLSALARRLSALRPAVRLESSETRLARILPRLLAPARSLLETRASRLAVAEGRLASISPFAVLLRGYSITQRADGSVLRDVTGVREGEVLETRLAEGRLSSRVESVALEPDGAARREDAGP
jgi:exodeoxyribonuclease VII large subunit